VPDCVAGITLGVICFAVTPILLGRWPAAADTR